MPALSFTPSHLDILCAAPQAARKRRYEATVPFSWERRFDLYSGRTHTEKPLKLLKWLADQACRELWLDGFTPEQLAQALDREPKLKMNRKTIANILPQLEAAGIMVVERAGAKRSRVVRYQLPGVVELNGGEAKWRALAAVRAAKKYLYQVGRRGSKPRLAAAQKHASSAQIWALPGTHPGLKRAQKAVRGVLTTPQNLKPPTNRSRQEHSDPPYDPPRPNQNLGRASRMEQEQPSAALPPPAPHQPGPTRFHPPPPRPKPQPEPVPKPAGHGMTALGGLVTALLPPGPPLSPLQPAAAPPPAPPLPPAPPRPTLPPVERVVRAVSSHGRTNPASAEKALGEALWQAVGGTADAWARLCLSPSLDDLRQRAEHIARRAAEQATWGQLPSVPAHPAPEPRPGPADLPAAASPATADPASWNDENDLFEHLDPLARAQAPAAEAKAALGPLWQAVVLQRPWSDWCDPRNDLELMGWAEDAWAHYEDTGGRPAPGPRQPARLPVGAERSDLLELKQRIVAGLGCPPSTILPLRTLLDLRPSEDQLALAMAEARSFLPKMTRPGAVGLVLKRQVCRVLVAHGRMGLPAWAVELGTPPPPRKARRA